MDLVVDVSIFTFLHFDWLHNWKSLEIIPQDLNSAIKIK